MKPLRPLFRMGAASAALLWFCLGRPCPASADDDGGREGGHAFADADDVPPASAAFTLGPCGETHTAANSSKNQAIPGGQRTTFDGSTQDVNCLANDSAQSRPSPNGGSATTSSSERSRTVLTSRSQAESEHAVAKDGTQSDETEQTSTNYQDYVDQQRSAWKNAYPGDPGSGSANSNIDDLEILQVFYEAFNVSDAYSKPLSSKSTYVTQDYVRQSTLNWGVDSLSGASWIQQYLNEAKSLSIQLSQSVTGRYSYSSSISGSDQTQIQNLYGVRGDGSFERGYDQDFWQRDLSASGSLAVTNSQANAKFRSFNANGSAEVSQSQNAVNSPGTGSGSVELRSSKNIQTHVDYAKPNGGTYNEDNSYSEANDTLSQWNGRTLTLSDSRSIDASRQTAANGGPAQSSSYKLRMSSFFEFVCGRLVAAARSMAESGDKTLVAFFNPSAEQLNDICPKLDPASIAAGGGSEAAAPYYALCLSFNLKKVPADGDDGSSAGSGHEDKDQDASHNPHGERDGNSRGDRS